MYSSEYNLDSLGTGEQTNKQQQQKTRILHQTVDVL